MFPDIDPDSYKPGPNSTQLLRGTEELGHGFALLHFADKNYVRLPRDQELIIQDLIAQSELAMRPEWLAKPTVPDGDGYGCRVETLHGRGGSMRSHLTVSVSPE